MSSCMPAKQALVCLVPPWDEKFAELFVRAHCMLAHHRCRFLVTDAVIDRTGSWIMTRRCHFEQAHSTIRTFEGTMSCEPLLQDFMPKHVLARESGLKLSCAGAKLVPSPTQKTSPFLVTRIMRILPKKRESATWTICGTADVVYLMWRHAGAWAGER